jgi:hypothetical protein
LSESEKFNDFSNPEALIWSEKGMVYGDWSSGSNNDGTSVHNVEFQISEVSVIIMMMMVITSAIIMMMMIRTTLFSNEFSTKLAPAS